MFGKGKALRSAIMGRQFDEVRRLLRAGADPNSRYRDGYRPLHVAVINRHAGIVDLLIQAGAEVEAKTKAGDTALHLAVEKLDLTVARELLDRGANPNARNGCGNTPLEELSRLERIFREPVVLNGVRVSSDDQIRGCQAMTTLLVQKGAVP